MLRQPRDLQQPHLPRSRLEKDRLRQVVIRHIRPLHRPGVAAVPPHHLQRVRIRQPLPLIARPAGSHRHNSGHPQKFNPVHFRVVLENQSRHSKPAQQCRRITRLRIRQRHPPVQIKIRRQPVLQRQKSLPRLAEGNLRRYGRDC